MKNIKIIGGHGFIGQNLCENFQEEQFLIDIIGINTSSITISNKNISSINLDIKNSELLVESCEDADVVIWLASTMHPGLSGSTLIDDFDSNIKPIILFLEKIRHSNINLKKFIFLSSGGTVYGNSEQKPITENHFKNPISNYGLSKLVTEEYIKFLTLGSNFQSYILRPSNVFGKYQNLKKAQGIIGFAFLAALNDRELTLYNKGEVVRDFIHVSDLAEAIKLIIKNDLPDNGFTEVYNIGSGIPMSMIEVIEKVQKVSEKEINLIHKSDRGFDCNYNVLDTSAFREKFNWTPKIDFEQGLKEIWEWIKNEK